MTFQWPIASGERCFGHFTGFTFCRLNLLKYLVTIPQFRCSGYLEHSPCTRNSEQVPLTPIHSWPGGLPGEALVLGAQTSTEISMGSRKLGREVWRPAVLANLL